MSRLLTILALNKDKIEAGKHCIFIVLDLFTIHEHIFLKRQTSSDMTRTDVLWLQKYWVLRTRHHVVDLHAVQYQLNTVQVEVSLNVQTKMLDRYEQKFSIKRIDQ